MDTTDWTDIEVELIVADYFSMLKDELRDLDFNKTNHRKAILPLLNNRSNGSVEFKHQNISAVLTQMGYPYIKGYKPRFNFQRTKLTAAIDRYIQADKTLEPLFIEFSDEISGVTEEVKFLNWVVNPPEIKGVSYKVKSPRRPIKTNFLKREQEN